MRALESRKTTSQRGEQRIKPYLAAVILFILVIVAAHLAAPPAYDWRQHTMSHLGGQGYDRGWIMRFGLIAFGGLVVPAAAWNIRRAPRKAWPHAFIGLYGLSILLSGIYSTAPFESGVPFSGREAALHSIFATAAGVGLSAAMFFFTLAEPTPRRRALHFSALALTTLLSAAFGLFPAVGGVLQRLLWLVGFSWLALLEVAPAHVKVGMPLVVSGD